MQIPGKLPQYPFFTQEITLKFGSCTFFFQGNLLSWNMIKRHQTHKIQELITQYPAVALLGPRQVGKTTLAKQITDHHKERAIYLDLEDNRDLRKLDDPHTFFDINKNKLVIIDEVQTLPQIFTALRPAIDSQRTSGRFLLLGSASPSLVKGVSETLAGRIAYVELTPFHMAETIPHTTDQQTLWLRGGFPPSLLAAKRSASMSWRRSFIKSYVQKELLDLFHVDFTSVTVQNFWQMLAHYHGRIWNANIFAGSLGVTAHTVRRYLDYMEGAFLIKRLQSWFVNAKKRLVKSPKVYVRDSGILHALLDIEAINDLYGHPVAGNSWEGFVIEQVEALLPEGIRVFYYRTHAGAESDLVLVKGVKPVAAIEIKLSSAPVISRGFYECINDLRAKYKFVIIPTGDDYIAKGAVQVCSLQSFLENHLPLLLN